MRPRYLPVSLFLALVILSSGCAPVGQQSPSEDVRAFFVTANEANFLGVQNMSPKCMDLSGYTHLMGVKYPPTYSVDVLSDPPARPYQAFAVLESPGPSASEVYDSVLLEGFKNRARAIGADAIILCRPGTRPGLPGLPMPSKIGAVAVKYRLDQEGQPVRP